MGSWSESISWGSCCGAAVCKSIWGKRLVLLSCACFFTAYNNFFALLEGGSAWILSCLVLLFAALTTREPLCYWIFSVWERQMCLILFHYFLAKHLGVVGRSYDMIWFAGRVLRVLRPFLGTPWCCNFMGNLIVSGLFFMAHVCGLDTAARKPTGREYTNV
ncbi:hypothetical protein V8C42DRAFT_245115 [Trichoderma barbatum]